MAAYRRVDDLRSPAGWLPVHRDQLWAQRSVSSMGSLYLYTKPSDWLGEHLQNDLFCIERDLKPQLNQSVTICHHNSELVVDVLDAEHMYWRDMQGSHASWKILQSPGFLSLKFPGPGKSWKLNFEVLESPGIYLWFKLTAATEKLLPVQNTMCK